MDLSLERYAEVTRPGEWPLGLGPWGAMDAALPRCALGAWLLGWATANSGKIREEPNKNGIREFGRVKLPTDFDPEFAEFSRIFSYFCFFPENAVFDR